MSFYKNLFLIIFAIRLKKECVIKQLNLYYFNF